MRDRAFIEAVASVSQGSFSHAVSQLRVAEQLLHAFAATYRGKYGYYYDDVAVELVTVHVTGAADDRHDTREKKRLNRVRAGWPPGR